MANRGYFKKGEKKPGQGKRGPNKITVEVKKMIEDALAGVGGTDYLMRQAEENPGPFMALVGKILPKEIKAEHCGEVGIQLIQRVIVNHPIVPRET